MTAITGAKMDRDRTVHAYGKGYEVVRYDRAGKWYVESVDGSRRAVTLDQAVREAAFVASRGTGDIFWGQPGGRAFDFRLRRHLNAEQV
jgi:hypothetical protein